MISFQHRHLTRHSVVLLTTILLSISQFSDAADLELGTRIPTSDEIVDALKPNARRTLPAPARPASKALKTLRYRGAAPKTRGIVLAEARANGKAIAANSAPGAPGPTNARGNGIALPVLFGFDSFQLTPRAHDQLAPIAQALKSEELAGLVFRVEGHTDATGPDYYNFDLSTKRALAVRNHLINQHSIQVEKVLVVGLGESMLANPNFPEDPGNRRVRIVVHGH